MLIRRGKAGFMKTARLQVLTTPAFRNWLRKEASKAGVSVGELVRTRCEQRVGDEEAALADLVESFLLAGPAAVSIAKSALRGANVAKAQSATSRQAMIEEAKEGAASFREKRHPSWYPPASS